MQYKVLLAFSYKSNGQRKIAEVGKSISDKELDPLILKYALARKKIKPFVNPRKVESQIKVSEPVGKKKVNRSSSNEKLVEKSYVVGEVIEVKSTIEEPIVEKIEENISTSSIVSFDEVSLNKKSKSQLKRICAQLGLGGSGTKKMLVKRLLKSGI